MFKKIMVWSYNTSAARLFKNPSDDVKVGYVVGGMVGMLAAYLHCGFLLWQWHKQQG